MANVFPCVATVAAVFVASVCVVVLAVCRLFKDPWTGWVTPFRYPSSVLVVVPLPMDDTGKRLAMVKVSMSTSPNNVVLEPLKTMREVLVSTLFNRASWDDPNDCCC